jgi:hypothetical protein
MKRRSAIARVSRPSASSATSCALARAETVRARDEREHLLGGGGAEGDRDRAGAAVDTAGLDDGPASVAGPDADAGRVLRRLAALRGQQAPDGAPGGGRDALGQGHPRRVQRVEPGPCRRGRAAGAQPIVEEQDAGLGRR